MSDSSTSLHEQWDTLTLPLARERRGFKWSPYAGTDLIPAWVADMDLPASARITEEITNFYAHGDLGYFDESIYERSKEVCSRWFSGRYGWEFPASAVELVSDTVQSLHLMVQHFSHPGDRVALITPVYHHFYNAIIENGRIPAPVTLTRNGGEYVLDMDELRSELRASNTKLLLLCHPHNPTGKVFSTAELTAIAESAREAGVIVISDEIHADLTYEPGAFLPFAHVARETGVQSVTLTAAGKAFNIAGTHLGFIIYSDPAMRIRSPRFPSRAYGKPGIAGCLATNAAWTTERPWLEAAVSYLRRNRDHLVENLQGIGITVHPPEATYLAWLDFSGITDDARQFLLEEARVVTSSGSDFAWPRGTGHEYARVNFATSFPVVQEITDRIRTAVTSVNEGH